MAFIMEIYTDGGCRGNGSPEATSAAARKYCRSRTRILPSNTTPTSQRAELTAIILALEQALVKYDELHGAPRLKVRIYSDSKYAVGCMTGSIDKWANNGWTNARENPVSNQDLIRKAADLDGRVKEEGSVRYILIPRAKNDFADRKCNEALDGL
ncbi:ribonuclease H1 [Penicillium angulare]|uniref:ribonuclease H1 n=1 Tax=Penicillium angulare TaxID=116970 RepID=UPI0025414D29|nr:ribonuclease H1 [Penicillium angulare]KAJ5267166.1 ribonuclease H1 [Penicillium angulare]